MINWKNILKTAAHAALGGAVAGVAPIGINLIPMIPHIDPYMAAVLGSIASSALSAAAPSTLKTCPTDNVITLPPKE